MSFTTVMDEMLIELVKEYSELYDNSHRLYSDVQHKRTLWVDIGQRLHTGAAACKQRWESLRSQYRKFRRNKKIKNDHYGESHDIKWKYSEHLEFLLPHMKEKSSSTDPIFIEEGNIIYYGEITHDETENSESKPQDPLSVESHSASVSSIKRKSSPKEFQGEAQINSKRIKEETKVETKDELDYFFDGIKTTVKKFSDNDKYLIKKKIFMLVTEVEQNYL